MLVVIKSIRSTCGWLWRAWARFGHLNQHWVINIAIGVTIALAIIVARDNRIVVAAQNWALDVAMQGAAEANGARDRVRPALTFIDIDEETWRNPRWGGGEPFRAPRKGLLALVDYALEHEARYLVVDVIVESRDDPEDIEFAHEIEKRATRLEETKQHLFFVRTIRDPLKGLEQLAPQLRSSPVDAAIRRHPEQLHAVEPYFRVSRDGVLRTWQMWRIGCRSDAESGRGHWEVMPSVQLAIASLVQTPEGPQRFAIPWSAPIEAEPCAVDLTALAQENAIGTGVQSDERVQDWLRTRPDITGFDELPESTGDLSSHIFFKFHYPPNSWQVRLIPALNVLESTFHGQNPDFAHGVVVIGQSFEAARDQHATPLGAMPGAMVLINSINSILDVKLLREPNRICEVIFELISIILIGYLFARFDSFTATVGIFLTFVPILIGLNYLLLRSGIWLDFAVPLLGIFAHRMVAGFEEYVSGWWGRE